MSRLLTWAPWEFLPKENKMDALRYGAIGTGRMGQGHIKVLLHIDGVELAALAVGR